MKKNYRFVFGAAMIFVASCSSNSQPAAENQNATLNEPGEKNGSAAVDDSIGNGKFTNIKLTHPLDNTMIDNGKIIYGAKCGSCHKLTDEKLIGPGWKGVTNRRRPEWIMNFITNTDEMIDKDQNAQAMLEKCMVRMPNQHLSDEDARNMLEYMRKNDGKK